MRVGVRARRPSCGVSVGAQVSYDDRENFGRVAPGRRAATCCASRWPTRSGRCRRSRRAAGHDGALPQAARRALPPGARRRGAGAGGAGRVGTAAGARHARGAADAGRARPGGRCCTRASRTAATTPDGRLVPRSEPGRACWRTPTRSWRRPCALAGPRRLAVPARRHPGAVEHARAVRRALEAAGGLLARALRSSPQAVDPEVCGEYSRESVEVTRSSCGANCGTRRMSNFLRRTPCAGVNPGS